MEITISGTNEKLLDQVERLARALGLDIKHEQNVEHKETNPEKLYRLMTDKARSGGIESIKDPETWQREIRKDKILHGRE